MTESAYEQAAREQAKIAAFNDALEILIDPIPETITLSDLTLITGQIDTALRPLADMPNEDGTIPAKADVELICKDFYVELRHKVEQLKNAANQAFAAL